MDEKATHGHAIGPGFPLPGAEDAETHLPVDIKIGMDPVASMLNELDSRGLHGVLAGDLKVQLDEFVAVEAVIRANDVGVKLEQVVILEYDKVVRVLLLELLALLGHAFYSQTCGHCGCLRGVEGGGGGEGLGRWLKGQSVPTRYSVFVNRQEFQISF